MQNTFHQINYGSKRIKYSLSFATRKSLGIKVTPNGDVYVLAPVNTELIEINKKLKSKADWIMKQLAFFGSYKPHTPARKFVSGETHLYLGRQYLLQVKSDKLKAENGYVKLYRGKMEVYTNNPSAETVEKVIENFYREKANELFPQLLSEYKKLHKKFSTHQTSFIIKKMRFRWGSCTKAGKIILNPELIKAPKACVEYVIIHELCHLVHYNHNKEFYALLSKLYPDWGKWKEKLECLLA